MKTIFAKVKKQNDLNLSLLNNIELLLLPHATPLSPENIIVKTAILVANTEKLKSAWCGLSSILDLR